MLKCSECEKTQLSWDSSWISVMFYKCFLKIIILHLVSEKKKSKNPKPKDPGINSASTYVSWNQVSLTELLLICINAAESRICPVA